MFAFKLLRTYLFKDSDVCSEGRRLQLVPLAKIWRGPLWSVSSFLGRSRCVRRLKRVRVWKMARFVEPETLLASEEGRGRCAGRKMGLAHGNTHSAPLVTYLFLLLTSPLPIYHLDTKFLLCVTHNLPIFMSGISLSTLAAALMTVQTMAFYEELVYRTDSHVSVLCGMKCGRPFTCRLRVSQ